jgi:ribosomal protein S18 acetylase RimI-like enzyme
VFEIESLQPWHDRAGFDCGIEPLNLFLQQTARQHAERGVSQTFVLVREDAAPPKKILGYFALSICQVDPEEIPEKFRKRLPRVVGGIKLGRLAVALEFQRQGLGRLLMAHAFAHFVEAYARVGGIGMFVDAKDERAALFYEQFGFERVRAGELVLYLPAPSIAEIVRSKAS